MDLKIGDKIEERSRNTDAVINNYVIDRITKKFAFAGKTRFQKEPIIGTTDNFSMDTTFRISGICMRVSDCGGTCEKCTCQE